MPPPTSRARLGLGSGCWVFEDGNTKHEQRDDICRNPLHHSVHIGPQACVAPDKEPAPLCLPIPHALIATPPSVR